SLGGIGIFFSVLFGLFAYHLFAPKIIWLFGLFSVFALIGFLDDILSLLKKKNLGLKARHKLVLQLIASVVFLVLYHLYIAPLSLLFICFSIFVITGSANATNLTDGLDGLLSGLCLIALLGFFFYLRSLGLIPLSHFCTIIMLSLVVFLIFNKNPAKIFMGDTGSLALGAFLAGLAIILNNYWILISLGGIFIIETLSVIIQVISYKLTKKRVFLMSPLHHHFELLGLSQASVVKIFWICGFIFLINFFLTGAII
ncbi:phospho-N-acetylmuramoyl-pentapeptide-transferase, partial [Candidatus Margulisiibacteriota bacterium]